MSIAMQLPALDVAHNVPAEITLCIVAAVVVMIVVGIVVNARRAKQERELFDPAAHPETISNPRARCQAQLAVRRQTTTTR